MTQARDAAAAWIYRGVWATVVALFRVPPEPPMLPSQGEHVRAIRPSPGFLRYLKFFFWLLLIPGDVLPALGWVAIYLAMPLLALALLPLLIVVLVLPDVIAYIGIHLRYDTTWYVLTDRSLRIRRGLWVVHETTISFENVQNVEVRQGPVQRYFGIADVVVQTAGGGAAKTAGAHGTSSSGGAHVALLQGLDDAESVRDAMLDRVKRARSAGLGDEVIPVKSREGARVLSEAHLAVLRDIRDVTARLSVIGSP